MEKYANQSHLSGVAAFEIGADYVTIEFVGGDQYRYSYRSPGKRHVEKMKRLAKAGKGLSTYISQHIRDHYERKLQ